MWQCGIPNLTFTLSGIQHLLSTLYTNKASGPSNIYQSIVPKRYYQFYNKQKNSESLDA